MQQAYTGMLHYVQNSCWTFGLVPLGFCSPEHKYTSQPSIRLVVNVADRICVFVRRLCDKKSQLFTLQHYELQHTVLFHFPTAINMDQSGQVNNKSQPRQVYKYYSLTGRTALMSAAWRQKLDVLSTFCVELSLLILHLMVLIQCKMHNDHEEFRHGMCQELQSSVQGRNFLCISPPPHYIWIVEVGLHVGEIITLSIVNIVSSKGMSDGRG